MRGVFFNRNFLLLSVASGVSQIGSQIAFIATIFWLRNTTDSASLLGLLATTAAIPLLLLSPLGGVFADRWSRRKILIVCDIICCLLCVSLMFFSGATSLPLMFAIVGMFASNLFLFSCISFNNPASQAILPDIVPQHQWEQAMGFRQALNLISMIGGQALGALLLTHYSPPILFVIDGATYLASAAMIFLIRTAKISPKSEKPLEAPARVYDDIRVAAQYIWRRPGMRLVLIAAIPVSIFTETIIVFLPFYTTNALSESLSYYPYLLAIFTTGSFLGYALIAKSTIPAAQKSVAVTGSLILSSAICMSLVLVHTYWVAALLLLFFGSFMGSVSLLCMNALVSQTDQDKRGRVNAILIMLTQGVTPLAMSLLGIAVDLLSGNPAPLYGACGLALLLVALTFSSSRDVRYFFGNRSTALSGVKS